MPWQKIPQRSEHGLPEWPIENADLHSSADAFPSGGNRLNSTVQGTRAAAAHADGDLLDAPQVDPAKMLPGLTLNLASLVVAPRNRSGEVSHSLAP